MMQRNSKGRFTKRGGSRKTSRRGGSRRPSVSIVKVSGGSPARRAPRRRARSSGGGGGTSITGLAIAAAAVGFVSRKLESSESYKAKENMVQKVPGHATFGTPAIVGLACLAVDRFAYRNKYLRLAGLAGVVLAASQVGTTPEFKWLGDASRAVAGGGEAYALGSADLDADDHDDAARG